MAGMIAKAILAVGANAQHAYVAVNPYFPSVYFTEKDFVEHEPTLQLDLGESQMVRVECGNSVTKVHPVVIVGKDAWTLGEQVRCC